VVGGFLVGLLREERLLLEERRQGLDSILTTKDVGVAGGGVGCAISWKATDSSLDDTVDGIVGVRRDVSAVLVLVLVVGRVLINLLEERRQRRRRRQQGLDSILTTKHVVGAVVGGGGGGGGWKIVFCFLQGVFLWSFL